MKILMLGWELPPHNSGGLGVACLNMARALSREGAEIDFVVPYKAPHDDANFMNVISATDLDPIFSYGGAYDNFTILDHVIPTATTPTSIREIQKSYQSFLASHLADFKPDVIHAHDWLTFEAGMLAQKSLHKPLIAHVHATEFDRAGMRPGNPLIHEIEYEGLMAADEIIAVSESTKRLIHEKYHIPLGKIDVIYNPLDESYEKSAYHFSDDPYKYLESLKSDGYTIVSTVGRFTIQKGLHNLLHAAAIALKYNPHLMFILAGNGEELSSLIETAANLGIAQNVIFTGFIRGKKLRDIYSISDIFVMSSISEPFGLTALEAAHHGNALILSKQSGVSEIIWSSLKYDFWDERKLAEEIVAISTEPALKSTLTANIKQEYHQFSWDDVAKKCMKVYNKNIKHKRF
ncbi:glycosyltransferase family 4 protein [Candidatus Saccharibacteria bacterium]|nr:glycosyltransferase family 4 protein [Candidatus Saccharibacteria bacterium]